MRTSLRRIAMSLMGLFLSLALPVTAALAAGGVTVELPVRITAEGTLPKTEETYVVRLTANKGNEPMPNHQRGGSYELSIVGLNEKTFPAIEYKDVGIYTYTIEQLAGTYPDCVYDHRAYTMRVAVTNAKGGGFDITMALREGGKEEKSDTVVFHNRYKVIPKQTSSLGTLTPTGVSDHWIFYMAGSAALLCVAGYILSVLRRKEGD